MMGKICERGMSIGQHLATLRAIPQRRRLDLQWQVPRVLLSRHRVCSRLWRVSATPCQLHCRPKGRMFSVMLKDMVVDGTPCRPGRRDVCISGRCRVSYKLRHHFILTLVYLILTLFTAHNWLHQLMSSSSAPPKKKVSRALYSQFSVGTQILARVRCNEPAFVTYLSRCYHSAHCVKVRLHILYSSLAKNLYFNRWLLLTSAGQNCNRS